MAKHNYCTRCSHYKDCGFISRGLEDKCDILDIFDAGADAAIDKASQWLQDNVDKYLFSAGYGYGLDRGELIIYFKKAMQDESK